MARNPISKKTKYIRDTYCYEDDILYITKESAPKSKVDTQIGSDEGKLIQILLKLHESKNVLEIGSLVGYSGIWILRAIGKSGHLTIIEKNKKYACSTKKNITSAGLQKNVTILNGEGLSEMRLIEDSGITFDAIFIDADKSNYINYIKSCNKLLRSKGLLIADNTLLFGKIYENNKNLNKNQIEKKNLMQSFHDYMNRNYYASIIPTDEGLSIGIKY